MSGQTLFNKALPMTQVHGVIFAASSLWKLLASFFEDYSKVLFFGKGFPDSSVGKESTCNTGDPSSIPGLGRCAGEGIGYPLQYSWASPVAQLVKNPPAMWRPGFDPWIGKIPWRRESLPTLVFWPREFHGL